ncbi:MAG: hypothetical protein GC139_08830 [Sideroxydans sp.]|nr:hypothetical protein [Sideroxydans sp.]
MKHDGFLVLIFLALGLIIPAIVFMRVYSVAFSGLRSSTPSKDAGTPNESAESARIKNQQPDEKENT